jgi:hypothetical protein
MNTDGMRETWKQEWGELPSGDPCPSVVISPEEGEVLTTDSTDEHGWDEEDS